ncbi:MAG: hypothetical protein HY735_33270 [Verrucomicrobia bacterium]|nr:hypothetical protein [Verrucomicrobiota bacterium]
MKTVETVLPTRVWTSTQLKLGVNEKNIAEYLARHRLAALKEAEDHRTEGF